MADERDDDVHQTTNEVKAPAGVRDVIQAGRIGRYVVNHPLQSYLAAFTGAALVVIGVVLWATLGTPTVEGSANGAPTHGEPATTTRPTTTEPTTEPPATTTTIAAKRTTTTTSAQAVPPSVPTLWQGTVKLRGDGSPRGGWFFDEPPPREAFTLGDLAYGGAATVTSDAVADLPDDAPPEQERCAGLLHATAGITRISARVGNAFCFATRGGRVGHAVVTGTLARDPLDPSITLDVIVWDLPG